MGLFSAQGLGATGQDGHLGPVEQDRKLLGARVLFRVPFEVGYRLDGHTRVSVQLEHMSNGDTNRYTEGLDRLGRRYGHRS